MAGKASLKELGEMILILGRNGQIARALQDLVWDEEVLALGSTEVDFTRPDLIASQLDRHIETPPRFILNAAAYTAVDKAESERKDAFLINGEAVGAIARWATSRGSRILHYSTDYVFPGSGERAWTPFDATDPVNTYGASKLEGENQLRVHAPDAFILRVSWVVSEYGHNFVKTMLKLGRERDELSVVHDQIGSPMSARSIAELSRLMILKADQVRGGGTYHLSSKPYVSWHDFAQSIFACARDSGFDLKVKKVNAISSEEYPTPARRPHNSRMSDDLFFEEFGLRMRPWQEDLRQIIGRLR
ncbi:MAG: dTDP-4-dehydrorhamnose reductase [Bdellovibrionaceae bacterium]|nr:dTDP-4-dehydrorhamnose reductase [Pseudobdellovibrionaceae bacterium]